MSKHNIVIINNGQYNDDEPPHYLDFTFPLDHFQKHGVKAISEGRNILVTAHTGSGKTVLALSAIAKCLQMNKQALYISPIKTLSNQKFKEFSEKFEDVGILTGDVKINPTGQLLIMTAEILRNSLLRKNDETVYEWNFNPDNVGCVVLDEVHFINNRERGKVWEEIIINLKPEIQLVMLSATINGAKKMAQWIADLKNKPCHLIPTEKRPVPLQHYIYWNNNLHVVLTDKGKWNQGVWSSIDKNIVKLKKNKKLKTNQYYIQKAIYYLRDNMMLPANIFLLNRNLVEKMAYNLPINFLTGPESKQVEKIWNNNLLKYRDIYSSTEQWNFLFNLVKKGIGIHHSGLIPILKEIVEILYSKKLIKVLFATETFALGVNMPTKTTVFTQLTKFDGKKRRLLGSDEYNQMAGRAGRRGLDKYGNVIIIPNKYFITESDGKTILLSEPLKIVSKLDIDCNFILKRLVMKIEQQDKTDTITYLTKSINKSLFSSEINSTIKELEEQLEKILEVSKTALYDDVVEYYDNYIKKITLEHQLKNNTEGYGNFTYKLSNKVCKQKRKELELINIPIKHLHKLQQFYEYNEQKKRLETRLHNIKVSYQHQIDNILYYLQENNLLDENGILTNLGRIVAEVNECNTLILGYIINNNILDDLQFSEIVALLSIFIVDNSVEEIYFDDLDIRKELKEKLININDFSSVLMEKETELNNYLPFKVWSNCELQLSLFQAIKAWAELKSWSQIQHLYPTFEGNFVRNVLRLTNLIRNIEGIAKLTNNVILLDKLDGYQEKLIRDIVIIDSLYLS